jgi:hypothetical protein
MAAKTTAEKIGDLVLWTLQTHEDYAAKKFGSDNTPLQSPSTSNLSQ